MTTAFAVLPILPAEEVTEALEAEGFTVILQQADGLGHSVDGRVQLVPPEASPRDGSWAVVRDVADVARAVENGHRLWLRGRSAGGRIGDATTLVLLRAAHAAGATWVAEGLGVRGSAAALAVGAAGPVLDGLLWRAPDLPWGRGARALLSRARRPRDTAIVGELAGSPSRLLFADPRARRTLDGLDAEGLARALDTARNEELRWLAAPATVAWAPDTPLVALAVALRRDILARAATARAHHPLRTDPLGTGRPVVQGPMANVAERVGLARHVAAAGALPFCALGALAPDDARAVLRAFRPLPHWGAGIIGFEVMPHRDAHLEALVPTGTRPVIIAGGSVPLARSLMSRGLEPWLHTPDPSLVRAALDAALPAVVLEGHEAGGHVGALTADVLWEGALAEVEGHPHHPLVVLAGGLGDAVSAAFAAAMASEAHRCGARVVLQAGTAFLLTHEALEEGQVTAAYQVAALAARTTRLVGSTVNLPLRCAPSPFVDDAVERERAWRRDGLPLGERRARMEHHNLGRARLAAKGIERHPDWGTRPDAPHYRSVPPHRQREEAAFTVGMGATVTPQVQTVAHVVEALSTRAADLLERVQAPSSHPRGVSGRPSTATKVAPPAPRTDRPEPIAVVSLGCVLPGAADVPGFWDNLLRGVDSVGTIPRDRWTEGRYVGADHDQSTTRRAGAVHLAFDPLDFRIPPRTAPTMDRAQKLALLAAREAVARAPWLKTIDRRRAAVVLGNSMGGEHSNSMAVRIRYRSVLDAVAADELTAGWHVDDLDALRQRVSERLDRTLPPVDVDSMAGLLGNVVAGRVASWLDWMGGNLTVDAACAASLAAVTVASDWLRNGRCDVVLTGGVDADLSPETYVGFCRTHALSPSGSSPFSADADGFVMGEGAGVLVLMRLSDALRRGAPIWAVLEGLGVASDGRSKGITAPKAEAQGLAIRRALDEAGRSPAYLGAVEAHGTGTALGDLTEVRALSQRVGSVDHRVWLGSVKSNLGHLKGGAGSAGLTRAVLTALTQTAPPTLHAGPVRRELALPDALALPRRPVPLHAPGVGVSAFGFGGTDFHVVVGPPPPEALAPPESAELGRALPGPQEAWSTERAPLVLCFGADDPDGLQRAVAADRPVDPSSAANHRCRLAVCVDGASERDAALARARRWLVERGEARALGGELHAGSGPPGSVVWAFPGQGSQRVGALEAATRCRAGAEAVGRLGAPKGRTLWDWERHAEGDALAIHLALFSAGVAWAEVLRDAGVPCAATTGHSLGAFAALTAAGWLSAGDGLRLVEARGEALSACPAGGMIAVRLDERAAGELAAATGLSLAAVNAPGSVVLAGSEHGLERALALHPDAVRLAVPRAYHSPLVEPAVDALTAALHGVSLSPASDATPAVWSTRSAGPIAPDAVRHDLARAIADPVRFADTVHGLRDAAGEPWFIECGPGTVLTRLVERQGGRAIALDPGHRWGVVPAAAALWAAGHPQLLVSLPGTVVQRGLPALRPAQWSRPPASAGPRELADRARHVQDLRIAALADPSAAPAWEHARRALLDDLAAHDAAGVAPRAAPVASEAPPPPPAPTPQAPAPNDDLHQAVLEAIAEVTGYPASFIDADADLAEDLGVDSIRKMEILGVLEKRFTIRALDADFGALAEAGVDDLVDWIRRRRDEPMAEASVSAAPTDGAVFVALSPSAVSADAPLAPTADPASLLAWLCRDDPTHAVRGATPVAQALIDGFQRCRARRRGATVAARVAREVHPTSASSPRPDAPVVVATGGTTGIVARCLEALPGARVLVLGRRATPDDDAMARLSAAGIVARYASCDLTDPASVRKALARIPGEWGAVDVVVHGAGITRDGPPGDATDDDRAAVLGAKLLGARHLSDALGAVPCWVDFSSVVAHVGNPGQSLYAAANAALEALPLPAGRRLSIAWTAWEQVGMAADDALLKLMRARGVFPLDPDEGSRAFAQLLRSDVAGTVCVWAQRPTDLVPLASPLTHRCRWSADGGRWRLTLDPEAPALADHVVGGRPLVPAAVWVTALLAAAHDLDADVLWALRDVRVQRPTFVLHPRSADLYMRRTPDGRLTARITTDEGGDAVTALLEPTTAPDAVAAPEPLVDDLDAASLYRPDLLFHGPSWRLLQRTRTDHDAALADVRAANGQPRLAELVDAAHQLLCAWSDRQAGWLGLPTGADRWRVHGPLPSGPVRLVARPRVQGERVLADVQVVALDGRVVLDGADVCLQRAGGAAEEPSHG